MSAGEGRCYLALDASTSTGSVGVARGGRLLAEASVNVGAGHSSALLPAIDYVMRAAGVERSELDAVVVGSGPGSFTGVRIAAATAKGIAAALGIPLLAYSSLIATAAGAASSGGEVVVLFDARGRDVYAASYSFGDSVGVGVVPAAMTLDQLFDALRGREIAAVTGDAVLRHKEELERALEVAVSPPQLHTPRAASLLWLAASWPELGRTVSASEWEPDYLRASGAERIAAAKRAEAGV